MRSLSLICLIAAAGLASCTYEKQPDGSMGGEFHPPLTYRDWTAQEMMGDSGTKACAVASGHNGLQVLVLQDGNKVVSHQHRMAPGTVITLNVNGHTYRTPDKQFYPQHHEAIVSDLLAGKKAYLEWSEIYVSAGAQRLRGSTVIKLDGFKSALASCKF